VKFIVTTWETVEGVYEVEADSEEEARARFTVPPAAFDWEEVEQVRYQAFDSEIRSVRVA
jgi:hypothetical protein